MVGKLGGHRGRVFWYAERRRRTRRAGMEVGGGSLEKALKEERPAKLCRSSGFGPKGSYQPPRRIRGWKDARRVVGCRWPDVVLLPRLDWLKPRELTIPSPKHDQVDP